MPKNDYEAVILAGGRGTRLRPWTDSTPKPILPISNRPLISYIVDEVRNAGVDKIKLVLDYKKEDVRSIFGLSLDYVDNPYGTMIDGILLAAQQSKRKAFVGLSGDTLLTKHSIEYGILQFEKDNPTGVLVLARLPMIGEKRWQYVVSDNTLDDIIVGETKTSVERAGLILSTQEVCELWLNNLPFKVPAGYEKFSTGWNLLLKLLINKGHKIKVFFTDFPVFNVNTEETYRKSEEFVKMHLRK